MARNFRTATPQYLQDFIFEPDWKYLESSLIKRQTDFDKVGQMAELLGGQLKTPFLPFDRGHVVNAQEYYNNEIDTITNDLQNDRITEREAQKRIGTLSRNLQDELSTGLLGAVVGRYNNYMALDKLNEESFKKSPGDANMFKQYLYNKLAADTYLDPYTSFSPSRMVNLPLMTDDRYRKIYEKAVANLITSKSEDGRYIIKEENLDPIELQNEIYRIYMNDPEVQSYLSQQAMLGDERYFNIDSEGNISLKPIYIYKDRNGNIISEEEAQKLRQAYQNLSEKDKQKTPYPIREEINPDNLFIQTANGLGDIYGHKKTTWTTNDFALEDLKYQHDLGKIAAKGGQDRKTLDHKKKLEEKQEETPPVTTQNGYITVNNRDKTLKEDQKTLLNRSNLTETDINNLPDIEKYAYLRYLSSIESAKTPTVDELIKKDGWFNLNLKKYNNSSNFDIANQMITRIKDILKKNPSANLNNPENFRKILLKEFGNKIQITQEQIKNFKDQPSFSYSKPLKDNNKKITDSEIVEVLKSGFINELTSRYLDNIKPQMKEYYKQYSETTNSTSENPVVGLSNIGLERAKEIISNDIVLRSPQRVYTDASTGRVLSQKEVNKLKSIGYSITGMMGASNYGNNGFTIRTNDGRIIVSSENYEANNIVNPTRNLDYYYAANPENFTDKNNIVSFQSENKLATDIARDFSIASNNYIETDKDGNRINVGKIYKTIYINNTAMPLVIKRKINSSNEVTYEILIQNKNSGGLSYITPNNFGNSVNKKFAEDASEFINNYNKKGIESAYDAGLILQQVIQKSNSK